MRTARVFNGVGDVHVEWRPAGTRVRALAASVLVACMGFTALAIWVSSPLIGITGAIIFGVLVAAVLFGTVIKVNLMLNSMMDLGGSGFYADIGEWTQIKMLWKGVREPVITNTRASLRKKG
jgi:hypothetical protein